jgi:hypothetical protein
MQSKPRQLTPEKLWPYMAQFFVALFFLAAAYLKASEGILSNNSADLKVIFDNWIANGMPVGWYGHIMIMLEPYATLLAVLVIIGQAVVALLLLHNLATRTAGALLIIVQMTILLAVYNHMELRVINLQAVWLGLYYLTRGELKGRMWMAMTYALVVIGGLHLYVRFVQFGDPWLSSVEWQRNYFMEYAMSSTVWIKQFYLMLTAGKIGAFHWAASWWIKVVLTLGLLTRHRLWFGAVLLVMLILQTIVWLDTWTCEGVLWVITMFVWVAHQYMLQKTSEPEPATYLP